MRKVLAVSWMSALEALSAPATLLLWLTATIGTLLLPLFQFQRFTEDGRLARDSGMATAMLFGALLVIGGATRLNRALKDGTSALALTKPLSRGAWLCGQALGTAATLLLFAIAQGAATLLAEHFSPHYHTTGTYANIPATFGAVGLAVGALVLGALNHRFRNGRFTLCASLALPLLLCIRVATLAPQLHWGALTGLLAILLGLIQLGALAFALATRCGAGLTASLTLAAGLLAMVFLQGSAYFPLDALSNGGHVPLSTLLWLLPQSLCATTFLLWCGARTLHNREVAQ